MKLKVCRTPQKLFSYVAENIINTMNALHYYGDRHRDNLTEEQLTNLQKLFYLEKDFAEMVIRVATQHFDLNEGEF